jgi:hypothetical protein
VSFCHDCGEFGRVHVKVPEESRRGAVSHGGPLKS